MKIKIVIVVLLFGSSCMLFGKTKKSYIYSGGAQIHIGYGFVKSNYGLLQGVPLGIGGRMHFNLGKYFRIGSGGAVTSFTYKNSLSATSEYYEKNYLEIGYGGLTAEFMYRIGDFKVALGVLLGGGAIKNLHILTDNGDGTIDSVLTEYAAFIVMPTLIFEYFVTDSISLHIQVDYLMSNKILSDFQLGPRIYLGVLFNK